MRKSTASLILILCTGLMVLGLEPSSKPVKAQSDSLAVVAYLPVVMKAPLGPTLAGCPVFPANHVWNTSITHLPVRADSPVLVRNIGDNANVHADFGSGLWDGGPIGIPYIVVNGTQAKTSVQFEYADESDPGPYPIPSNPPIEGGPNSDGDRHILILDKDACMLYELFSAYPGSGGNWTAGSGAIFNLRSNALRPAGWTSADAAGLPILPGLVRYEEVAAGEIRHAVRFTAPRTRAGSYTWPARHYASSNPDASLPEMGMRFRLKASFDINRLESREARIIATALKTYGMILADNGSPWYISGAPDERWDNDILHQLDIIQGSDFEVVDTSSLLVAPNSGEARQP